MKTIRLLIVLPVLLLCVNVLAGTPADQSASGLVIVSASCKGAGHSRVPSSVYSILPWQFRNDAAREIHNAAGTTRLTVNLTVKNAGNQRISRFELEVYPIDAHGNRIDHLDLVFDSPVEAGETRKLTKAFRYDRNIEPLRTDVTLLAVTYQDGHIWHPTATASHVGPRVLPFNRPVGTVAPIPQAWHPPLVQR
ncbi:MAG TPA: hypothetical protein VEZ90_13975 [Blastocatellia bacterium]|nr:hypothetical protein [Blastocatellia bacterium]